MKESKLRQIIKEEVNLIPKGSNHPELSKKIFYFGINTDRIGEEEIEDDVYYEDDEFDEWEYSERDAFLHSYFVTFLKSEIVIPRKTYDSPSAKSGWYGVEKGLYSTAAFGSDIKGNTLFPFKSKEDAIGGMKRIFNIKQLKEGE